MILFATGRGGALKRFLVEDGIGQDAGFWKLAQALSALYPTGTGFFQFSREGCRFYGFSS
ncbi:MAG: hypothetical protein WCQ16_05095 [Verrucomicrobiae bacterium]